MKPDFVQATPNGIVATGVPSDADLFRSLGSIEGKQDLILLRLDQQDREQDRLKGTVESLDGRVSSVEKKLAYGAGALAIVTSVFLFFRDKIAAVLGLS